MYSIAIRPILLPQACGRGHSGGGVCHRVVPQLVRDAAPRVLQVLRRDAPLHLVLRACHVGMVDENEMEERRKLCRGSVARRTGLKSAPTGMRSAVHLHTVHVLLHMPDTVLRAALVHGSQAYIKVVVIYSDPHLIALDDPMHALHLLSGLQQQRINVLVAALRSPGAHAR